MTKATAKQVWSGLTNPNQIDESAKFSGCDFLILNALSVGKDNYEIAASIVIDVTADTFYLNGSVEVPQAPLGTKEIPLNISYFDTAVIVPLPLEATRSDCECKVCFATSYSINFEVFAISKKVLCDCKTELDQIQSDINFLKLVNSVIAVNQAAQDAAIAAFATGFGAALAPYTAGGSLLVPPAVATAIAPGVAVLTPLLLLVGV